MTKFYNQEMKDSHEGGYGWVTIKEALEKSSNVAVSKIISKLYKDDPQKFVDRLYKMNLNDKLELAIGGEGAPRIKKPTDKDWSGVTLPWMSIGYEVSQTPLQILTFYNAVANNGKMVKPFFVKEIVSRGKVQKSFKPIVLNESICSRSTIAMAQDMLEGVISQGTGRNLRNSPFKVAGKTGTIQLANKNYGYKYEGKFSYQASFVGYFPADKPKYSCIVVVNAPGKDVYYGNLVAGPVFKAIADKVYASSIEIHEDLARLKQVTWSKREDGSLMVPYSKYGFQEDLATVFSDLELPVVYEDPESKWSVALPDDSVMHVLVRKIEEELKRGVIPNVVGMNAKDAMYLLENAGVQVNIIGRGMIVKQSIIPGTKIYKGTEILLQLS
jgi:cell division protein FtsI (penicillin-binding protein 3)